MKVLAKARVIFDKVLNGLASLAGVMVGFMTLAVSYSVVMRYLLNRPPIWVVQVSEYMLLWITFLGAAWLLREGGHIRVDIITSHLSEKAQRVLGIITSAIGVGVCLVIVWFGTQTTWSDFQANILETKAVYIPKAPIISIIAIGSLLLFIQFVRNIWGYSRHKPNGGQQP